MTFKSTFAVFAAAFLSTAPAFALDATETLTEFAVDGDIQQTPNQILIKNTVIRYKSSTRGPVTEALRFDYEHMSNSGLAVCMSFGAPRLVDFNGSRGEEKNEKVLAVTLNKGKTAFSWVSSSESFVVSELLCEK